MKTIVIDSDHPASAQVAQRLKAEGCNVITHTEKGTTMRNSLKLAAAALAAATASSFDMLPVSVGRTPNKYNPSKGNSAEIERHNKLVEQPRKPFSKAQIKKMDAQMRKRLNIARNGGQ